MLPVTQFNQEKAYSVFDYTVFTVNPEWSSEILLIFILLGQGGYETAIAF